MNLVNKDVLLVDKPAGMSSFGVVARVRRVLTEQRREQIREEWALSGRVLSDLPKGALPKRVKVGHAGTLDPFATGLLICLLGKATKRAGEFLKLDKRYTATICLGKVSSTGDTEGEIVEYDSSRAPVASPVVTGTLPILRSRCRGRSREEHIPTISQIRSVLEQFIGEIVQRVPAYSAVKIDGRRAYDLARKGIEVEMPERKVQIYEISILRYEWPELTIDCKVSSGTYIRALGEDIGKALGVGGYLTALRRTEIGEYKVSDAVTLGELGIEN